jgi:DNA repair protein RadD
MGLLTLHDDQHEVLSNLRASMGKNKSVLLQAATGFGKTRVAQYMVQAAQSKGHGIIFTVPRRQLMEQTSQTFEDGGINHSYIAAGKMFNPYSRVYVGMIDTMARRLNRLPDAKLVIIDETHFGDGSLEKVINHYKARGSWVVGLSATPWKLSGKGLGCYYDDMVCGPSIRWLIDNKRLSDYRYFRGKTQVDFSRARVTAGDYNAKDIDGIIEANEGMIIGDAVKDYREKAMGRLHVVRCVSIKRSQIMAQAFRDAGIPAAHVDGETDDRDMDRILRAYARREILVLTFCDLLNFGFDLAQRVGMDVCVESGDDTKPSLSLAGQVQFWGRMMRMKEYAALMFDRVNNWQKHGLPDSDREWTLEDRAQTKKTTGERSPPSRQCLNCFAITKPAPICPECGHTHEIKSREIDEIDGDLVELSKEQREALRQEKIKDRKKEQGRAQSMEDLIALGKRKGYGARSTAWAAKIMAARLKKKKHGN